MIENFRHIAFCVEDIDTATVFYKELGGTLVSSDLEEGVFIESLLGVPGVIIKTCKLHFKGGERLELMEFVAPQNKLDSESMPQTLMTKTGLHHIAFTVDNLEVAINIVIGHGGKVVGSVVRPDSEHSVHAVRSKHVYMIDPFGSLLHLAEDI
ncbi:VOC family protein [Candidatus Nanopelagicus limnes]|uniref:VOC family protein n=1 Tax=Candidatus Nanopelagicus limnae TaxID=1884634 RepID=UPI000BBFEE8B|nr:VOC family protein [Candidatus Nanopelagicus limnes]